VRKLTPEQTKDGVWTVSAGNAAQGVAFAARLAGVPCSVMVMDTAPLTKLRSIEKLGATIVKASYDECWKTVESHGSPRMRGHFVHPFDDDDFIAGNATAGLEILEDLPDVDAVVAALGGGGLLSGIGTVMRAKKPNVRVYAAEPETAAPLDLSLKRGEPCYFDAWQPSFVDGAGGKSVLPTMWPLLKSVVDASIVMPLDESRPPCARPPIGSTSSPKAPAAPPSPRHSAGGPAPEKSSPSSPAATSTFRDSLNSSALTPMSEERFSKAAPLPDRIHRLQELALDLWWSWDDRARQIFRQLDYTMWRSTAHNPVQMLQRITPERLKAAAADPDFLRAYDEAIFGLDQARTIAHPWWREKQAMLGGGSIAYFSAEFALHQSLPIYAGGLGVLAGDHCKEAADLGLPFVGIGFMYPQGYFRQRMTDDGWQQERYERISWTDAPIEAAITPDGRPCVTAVPLGERTVLTAGVASSSRPRPAFPA
jgi:hypothetical protein